MPHSLCPEPWKVEFPLYTSISLYNIGSLLQLKYPDRSDSFRSGSFKLQSYFKTLSSNKSRLQFKRNSKMTPNIGSNFHHDPKYGAIQYLCIGCSVSTGRGGGGRIDLNSSIDTEDHVTRCVGYADLRQNLDLNVQSDMLTYFQLVIDRRIQEEQSNET